MDCELCNRTGGELLLQDERCRVVRFGDDPHFPQPIWAAPQRAAALAQREASTAAASALAAALD